MMPVVELYVLVDDVVKAGAVPACSDAEVLTIAVMRHLLGRPIERGFLAEVRRERPGLFPRLPHQSEFNRRVRWLWGACEYLRRHVVAGVPEDGGSRSTRPTCRSSTQPRARGRRLGQPGRPAHRLRA